jgi:hypothetical protein
VGFALGERVGPLILAWGPNLSGMSDRFVVVGAVLFLLVSCTPEPSGQSAPAPNLLSPAPEPKPALALNGECFVGIIRADRIRGPELLDLLGSHSPSWLPAGFGLFTAWRVEGGAVGEISNGGIWTDEGCRQVRLDVYPGGASQESPRPDGQWVLISDGECIMGNLRDVPCFSYHAQANGDALNLDFIGLSQEDARHVVAGVAV